MLPCCFGGFKYLIFLFSIYIHIAYSLPNSGRFAADGEREKQRDRTFEERGVFSVRLRDSSKRSEETRFQKLWIGPMPREFLLLQ